MWSAKSELLLAKLEVSEVWSAKSEESEVWSTKTEEWVAKLEVWSAN